MFDFLIYLFKGITPAEISPETPVEVWILRRYHTLFKCHVKSSTWQESEFNRMRVDPGEYGIGNPVIIVINTLNDNKITGHAIDQKQFQALYGQVPTFSHDQVTNDLDTHHENLQAEVEELRQLLNRLTDLTSP